MDPNRKLINEMTEELEIDIQFQIDEINRILDEAHKRIDDSRA